MLVAIFAPAALVPSLCVAFFISGIGIGVANSQSTAIRQIAVVPELSGRVNAGYRLASWGALSIGAAIGGLPVGVLGTMLAATAGAVLMTLATLPVALSPVPRVRAIEDVQPEGMETEDGETGRTRESSRRFRASVKLFWLWCIQTALPPEVPM